MRLHLYNTGLLLQENRPLRIMKGKGVTVRCLDGTAWLTADGEVGDRFLAAGETHHLGCDGLALVEAMGRQATIRLEPAQPGSGGIFARFLSRLRHPAHRFIPCRQQEGATAWIS